MEQVFRASTEQWRRAIALELIVRAYPNARRESFELLRTILADPAADPLERVAAMTGILIRLPDHEPERDSILRLVEEYAAQVGEADWLPSVGTPVDGGLFDVRIGSMANRTSGHWMLPGQLIVDYLRTLDSTWKSRTHVERLALGLLPSIIQGRGIDLYRRIQFYLQNGSRHEMDQQIAAFDIPLARWAEETEDAERLRALAEPLLGVSHRVYPLPTRAWKRILGDPLVDATLRGRFLQSLNPQMNAPIPLAAIFDELDWSALLLADDPLADHIVRTKFWQPIEEHRLAARASPRIEVQRWAWEVAPLPETPEELEPLIGSDDLRLREIGYGLALTAEDTRWLPVLHRAAREGPPSSREPAIDRLAFFADESSLPVLTALLDDPVFSVRAKALEALETIESVLEKQEKWRERFGEKKKD